MPMVPPANASGTRSTADGELAALVHDLSQLRGQPGNTGVFCQRWRGGVPLALAALPPRYTEVFYGLMDRLESSALFTDESCSFSQTDLLDSLAMWAEKATHKLSSPDPRLSLV